MVQARDCDLSGARGVSFHESLVTSGTHEVARVEGKPWDCLT